LHQFFRPPEVQCLARYEVLPGLPPYGDWPEAFSATGQSRHREGLVVQFLPPATAAWVGNFQPGLSSLDLVFDHPNGRTVVVVAGGQGYVVDPNDRAEREYVGGQIEDVILAPDLGLVLLGNGLWFEAVGPSGSCWRSRRVSWDGMREVVRVGRELRGEAWSPFAGGHWVPFAVDLVSGTVTGGSYSDPDRPAEPSAAPDAGC
jgi:hypothetical protein